ncbi:hypothetical protein KP509_23G021800 [Ceratopteris richardii]|uniref:Uncharacterized protein n=2 Tax=Ceratopteris richardii TaxID=49495 RepID=A0A8T2RXQ8_CERRI|nr:hypothetical protein KP509_23G021800 [Ceratopteris richardii]
MMESASQVVEKTMDRLKELSEELKRRTVLWILIACGLSYLLSLASSSILANVPVAVAFLIMMRYLSFELEVRKKVHRQSIPLHLSHLLKSQTPSKDYLIPSSISTNWRRKIDSPIIEQALDGFTRRIVEEFVTNSWYSALSPDQDVPEQIRFLVIDIFGELAQRAKRVNLINFITRDIVELIANHLELFRQSKNSIRRFESLSSEDREKELKLALAKGNQLHPALASEDSECKVLQRLMGGMVAIILRPHDAGCALVRGLARELLACAVLRPVINLVNPGFINKNIEKAILSSKVKSKSKNTGFYSASASASLGLSKAPNQSFLAGYGSDNSAHGRREHGSQMLDAVSDRRTIIVDNVDNTMGKGQDYRKRDFDKALTKQDPGAASLLPNLPLSKSDKLETKPAMQDAFANKHSTSRFNQIPESVRTSIPQTSATSKDTKRTAELPKQDKKSNLMMHNQPGNESCMMEISVISSSAASVALATQGYHGRLTEEQGTGIRHRPTHKSRTRSEEWQRLERAGGISSALIQNSDLPVSGNVLNPFLSGFNNEPSLAVSHDRETQSAAKLNSYVVRARLEKAVSETFAVYSIAVIDTDGNIWFVERRFRNFEKLHRKLRDLPHYNLQLPPKRFFSSSLDETFVRERCILLDKYLKDLLSIPSIAELHEVRDFLSIDSKNYRYSKSPSVMKTTTVIVDDALEDMFRHFKGFSDGSIHRVGSPMQDACEGNQVFPCYEQRQTVGIAADSGSFQVEKDKSDNYSDEEFTGPTMTAEGPADVIEDWPFDNGLHDVDAVTDGSFSQRMLLHDNNMQSLDKRMEQAGSDAFSDSTTGSDAYEEDITVPPEWTPPNLTEPLLNLVACIFQLQDCSWIRWQCFWIAKQVLQLGMGDAVDIWIITQIEQLRQEDRIAGLIESLQQILWPGGVFLTKAQKRDDAVVSATAGSQKVVRQPSQKSTDQSTSFEAQLEAARCAKAIHDCLVDGAPKPLINFVGKQQYVKSAKEIFYFLQSSLFVKQLIFSLFETLLVTVFPEMSDLILDIRQKGV